jgi:outer membrane protein assembly factor BamA
VSTRDYRDDFYEFSLETGYRTRLAGLTMVGLSVGWKRVEPTADLAGFSRYKAGFSISRETILNRTNPESGYQLHTELIYAYRRYSVDSLMPSAMASAFNETRTALTFKLYQPLMRSLVGHVSLDYRGLETSEPLPPISELYLLGGPGSIRGYRNEQYDARRAAFGTVEPRLRFYSGFLFVFCDAAYINRPVQTAGSVTAEELFRTGYGFGLSLSDSQRSVKISLGWGKGSAFDEPQVSIELGSDI